MSINFSYSLDDGFIEGNANDSSFKDFRFLNDQELLALTTFLRKVSECEPIPGKNKESWLDDNLNVIPGTHDYQDKNYWHYHCGPNYSSSSNYSFTHNLNRNIFGITSPEIIHYQKFDSEIVIVGFSPNHVPFPRADDETNPLFL